LFGLLFFFFRTLGWADVAAFQPWKACAPGSTRGDVLVYG